MSEIDQWVANAKREAAEKRKAEKALQPKGQKCSNCLHHRGHEFSPKYHYCKKGRSKHTPNGYAKTKPGGWCQQWEVKP